MYDPHSAKLLQKGKAAAASGDDHEAIYMLRRFLAHPESVWPDERAQAMMLLAQCCVQLDSRGEAERWLLRACAETPDDAGPWQAAAAFYALSDPEAAAFCRARAGRK